MVWQNCHVNDLYDVSDDGYVRRVESGLILKQSVTYNGYFYVQLWANGRGKNWRVNRLVLITFTGLDPDPTKIQVAHLNGDRVDNRLDNLAWKDAYGNYLDRLEHGTQVDIRPQNLQITEQDVATMRNHYANGSTQAAIAKRFSVSRSYVAKRVAGYRVHH